MGGLQAVLGWISDDNFSLYPATPLAGADLNNDGISSTDRPAVNGVHLARNSFRQPGYSELDLRLGKGFQGWGGNFELFAECYNCANVANRRVSADTIWGTGNAPRSNFGVRVDF